jgi:hypothetical protein
MIEKIDSEQNFMIFLDSTDVLKGISDSSTVNSTLHITQVLKDKIGGWNHQERKSNFTASRATAELKLMRRMRGPTQKQSKQSKKIEIVKLLLPVADLKSQWKKKGKEERHSFCQNTKRDKGESYFERYHRNDSSLYFHEMKMNRCAFMSINSMRAGHTSLKASLNGFNIVSRAKCECGYGLQTEKHTFIL